MIDLTKADHVEIFMDQQHKLWVNVDGKCLLRVGTVEAFEYDNKATDYFENYK
tara:strand:+ start:99 stop:257 length:159 start_codon:yes stop_codon:yes gene_type:complete